MPPGEPSIETPEIAWTVELLDGRRTLHRPVRSRLDAHDLLRAGLPGHALKHLVDGVAMLRGSQHDSLEKGSASAFAPTSAERTRPTSR